MNSKKDMDKGTLEQRKNMVNIMSENEEFIIIGLTGRVGSGCSEAAQIFGSSFNELELTYSGYKNDNGRDL